MQRHHRRNHSTIESAWRRFPMGNATPGLVFSSNQSDYLSRNWSWQAPQALPTAPAAFLVAASSPDFAAASRSAAALTRSLALASKSDLLVQMPSRALVGVPAKVCVSVANNSGMRP